MASTARNAFIMILLLVCMAYASPQEKAGAGNAGLSPDAVVYSQPPDPSGGLFPSSWLSSGGGLNDRYVWDNFTLAKSHLISEVDWIGGYDPTLLGSGGPVIDFTLAFYPSNIAGQPDILISPASYQVGGNAGQAEYGDLGGVTMYSYSFVLPAPFAALAGTKYWVQIYAWQNGDPDWGLTKGTGGDNVHFLKRCQGIYCTYFLPSGDIAFTLRGTASTPFWLPLIIR